MTGYHQKLIVNVTYDFSPYLGVQSSTVTSLLHTQYSFNP